MLSLYPSSSTICAKRRIVDEIGDLVSMQDYRVHRDEFFDKRTAVMAGFCPGSFSYEQLTKGNFLCNHVISFALVILLQKKLLGRLSVVTE